MKSLSEVRKIEQQQNTRYKARRMAFKLLSKAFDEYAYEPLLALMDKLRNGKALTLSEFKTVNGWAENYGKPIPNEKMSLVKNALMDTLILRHFNQFGQELR